MDNINKLHNEALTFLKEKKYHEAIEILKNCKAANPIEPIFSYNLGFSYHRIKEYGKAKEEYFECIENEYPDFEPYFHLGQLFYNEGNYKQAISILSEGIDAFPEKEKLYFLRFGCHRGLFMHLKAIEDISKVISINDKNPDFYCHRGIEFQILKKYPEALEDFNLAISLDPNHLRSLFRRSDVYLQLSNFNAAINSYNLILQVAPINIKALYQRAYAFTNIEKFEEAIEDYIKILLNYPKEMNCISYMGICYMNLGKYDLAINNFSQVIKRYPENIEILARRGTLYFVKQNYLNAKQDFIKSFELSKQNNYDLKQIDSILYTIALIFLEEKNIEFAIEYLVKSKINNFLIYLANQVYSLKNDVRIKLFKMFHDFQELVLEIKKEALTESSVCHYTGLTIADKIIMANESKLRYYNVTYMNDPEEGQVLFNLLNSGLNKLYSDGKNEDDFNIYLGSFLPEEEEDNLVMWRTYGKEKGLEAKGCSLVIESSFFDKELSFFPLKPITLISNSQENTLLNVSQSLYRVLYIDKKSQKVIGENAKIINNKIGKLNNLYVLISNYVNSIKPKNESLKEIFSQSINISLSEVLYLFKSSDYAYERELRVIVVASMDDERVKIDETQFPKKLYIESRKLIKENIKKVILGPKVENPSHWIYLKAQFKKSSLKLELKESSCKFK